MNWYFCRLRPLFIRASKISTRDEESKSSSGLESPRTVPPYILVRCMSIGLHTRWMAVRPLYGFPSTAHGLKMDGWKPVQYCTYWYYKIVIVILSGACFRLPPGCGVVFCQVCGSIGFHMYSLGLFLVEVFRVSWHVVQGWNWCAWRVRRGPPRWNKAWSRGHICLCSSRAPRRLI